MCINISTCLLSEPSNFGELYVVDDRFLNTHVHVSSVGPVSQLGSGLCELNNITYSEIQLALSPACATVGIYHMFFAGYWVM